MARYSLIRLAYSAMQLYDKSLSKGVIWEEGKSPIAVAVTALQTVRRNYGDVT